MANRYLVTGVQLGMILGGVSIIMKNPKKAIELIESTTSEIMDNQHIGYSDKEIKEDINFIKRHSLK
jgi:predicted sugar kinase